MKIVTIQLFLVIFLFGCATSPVRFSESRSVTLDRIYGVYEKYSQPKKSSSRLIVVRDSGALGGAGSASLFVNGDIIARLRTSESLVIHIDEGDNIIGVGPGTKMSWETDATGLMEQTIFVQKNSDYYFRIGVDPTKGLVLNRSSQLN